MSANSDSDGSWAMVDREDEGSEAGSTSSSSDFVKVQSSESVSYHHKDQATTGDRTHDSEVESDGAESASAVPPPLSPDMEDTVTNADDEASSIEELNLTELNTQEQEEQDMVVPEVHLAPAPEHVESAVPGRFKKPRLRTSISSTLDSESDHSDFVRLEAPSHSEMEDEGATASILLSSAPPGVLRIASTSASTSSANTSALQTSASSISSSFRFVPSAAGPPVNPVLAQQEQEYVRRRSGGYRRCYRRSHDELDAYALGDDHYHDDSDSDFVGHHMGGVSDVDDSVPSDVDDRCESDISGIAPDNDDDDWVMDDGEILLSAGNVRRTYRHHANPSLNSVLTTLAIMALFLALGTGFGHFLGIQRESGLRRQQEVKMRDLQDDYLVCLKQRDSYLKQVNDPLFTASLPFPHPPYLYFNGSTVVPNQKLNAITGVWKQKYEDLIVEKVELEQRIQDLEQELEDRVEIAQLQAQNHAEEMDRLQQELSGLKVQHTTSMVQAEAQLAEAREEDKHQLSELEQLTERLAKQEEENRGLLASLASSSSDNTELVAITDTALAEIEAKEAELSTKEAALTNKGAELTTREAELTNKGEELVQKESALMSREAELSNKEAELSRVQKEETALMEVKKTELAELKKQVADVRQRFQEVSTALAERKADLAKTQTTELHVLEVLTFKEELNQLRTENQELRSRLSAVLYQKPPLTRQPAVVDEPVFDEPATPETLITETIVSIPATEDLPELDIEIIATDDDDDLAEEEESNLHEELESTRNQLVAAEERAQKYEAMHRECMANAPEDFLSCMRLLLPNNTISGVNATEFMVRILRDARFTKAMEKHWAEFYQFLQQGSKAKLPRKVKAVYSELERTLRAKWREFVTYAHEQEIPIPGNGSNEKFQTVVNKTKETVSQLSEKIHHTWHKVKNLSSEMLKSNEPLGNLKDKVVSKVESVGEQVKKGWDTVREHVHGGWFHKKKPVESKKYEGHPQDHLGNSPFARERNQDISLEEFAKADSHGYNKGDNKQTQSSTLEQKYEEFWKRANYDPDDYVAEDFFQGNQREWKKQQKQFKKLHGRIHRLNEDMLYSMDDDDIEDMYEDLDDFEDDFDDLDKQPAKLKNWLTCQIRWWKSRFQRKHRNEDFVKGCDAQLMRWQLRAMCKPLCQGKKCRRHARTNVDACQALYAQTVIKPDSTTAECKESKDSGNETIVADFTMEPGVPSNHGKLFTMMDKREEPNFVLLGPSTPEAGDHDSSDWMWERYHSREYQRQEKPDWQFKRANRRAFEREKPWYYKRSDHRGRMWAEKQGKY